MNAGIDFELVHTDSADNSERKGILLFHGLTGSPFEMKKYGLFLHKNGFDVFCYSLPGHGERLDEIQSVTFRDWCALAQEKYENLRKNYDKFFVSGLCLGAAISLYLAEHNDDITGIIALSTTLFLDGASMPWSKFLMPLGLSTILRYYYTFPEDDCLGVMNEDTRKTLAKLMSKTTIGMDNYPLNCVNELLKLSKEVRKNLKKVNCPIILIHSKYDNLSSIKSAKVVYNNISSQIKEYVELNQSYHMVLYDNEKVFVMDKALEFINKFVSTSNSETMEAV